MGIATWLLTNFTTQDPTTYKSTIDGNMSVAQRIAANFAPQQVATPNMTIQVRAGNVFAASVLTEVALQTTGTITAPVTNPRIDRVVLDQLTGALSVITGTPAGSPTPPAITAGKVPCAQILLQTTSTVITNSMITDERSTAMFVDLAAAIHSATAKTSPVDADEIGYWDSVSGFLRKMSFANLKGVFALVAGSSTQDFNTQSLTASSNFVAGTGTANNVIRSNGANSGSGGGGIIEVRNNGAAIIQIGNYSAVQGGTYDARASVWSNGSVPILFNRGLASFSPSDGIGYATGAGGSVTQVTSITTSVTLNAICGRIVTVSFAWVAGTLQAFHLANSAIAATDTIICAQKLGTVTVLIAVNQMSAGDALLFIYPLTSGTSTVTFDFTVIKSVNA